MEKYPLNILCNFYMATLRFGPFNRENIALGFNALASRHVKMRPDRFESGYPKKKMKYVFDEEFFRNDYIENPQKEYDWSFQKRQPQINSVLSYANPHKILSLIAYRPTLLVNDFSAEEISSYWSDAASYLDADYAYSHVVSKEEYLYLRDGGWNRSWSLEPTCYYSITPWDLALGLCDQPWLVVFGPIYVKHFGEERLLSAPASVVRKLEDGRILIQLSEDYRQVDVDWMKFHQTRTAVIDHLGRDSYQTPDLSRPANEVGARRLIPAERVPPEFAELRQALLKVKREYEAREDAVPPKPPEITSLAELLKNVSRVRLATFKRDIIIVDDARKEFVGFENKELAAEWVRQLITNGVKMDDDVKKELSRPPKPPPLTSLQDILANASRLKLVVLKGSIYIFDNDREDYVTFPEKEINAEWMNQLILKGVEVDEKVKKLIAK